MQFSESMKNYKYHCYRFKIVATIVWLLPFESMIENMIDEQHEADTVLFR